MITLIVQRVREEGNAMMGVLTVCGGDIKLPQIYTLEDRWRNNAAGISCIPAGEYKAVPHGWKNEPVKFKKVWRLLAVPNREAILIHAGNTDADTHGCILVGLSKSQARVNESRKALELLQQAIGEKPLTVIVRSFDA